MSMPKILTIVGARPQFIKAATVSRELTRQGLTETLLHTGQHYDENMSDVFFSELGIPQPHYNLGIGSGTHAQQTGQMLSAIEEVLLDEKPQVLIVYGDTNSTLAGALAAAKVHIPVAHVEAGLRSFNRRMPEEVNRVLTDHISSLLFAPTKAAVRHLEREGISANSIVDVGDVMYDAALYYSEKAEADSRILSSLDIQARSYVLATVHRAENTDDPVKLQAIFEALAELAQTTEIILPLHPRTRKALSEANFEVGEGLRFIDPVGYLDMVMLEKSARAIVTDSGGIQKEAYFHAVPCLTLRDETEWVETVDLGANRLVTPLTQETIVSEFKLLNGEPVRTDARPYGDGRAAQHIVEALKAQYSR